MKIDIVDSRMGKLIGAIDLHEIPREGEFIKVIHPSEHFHHTGQYYITLIEYVIDGDACATFAHVRYIGESDG